MKNKLFVFLMLILFELSKITAFSQDRNVYWVHGFGGDASSLQHYATIFTNERKINSTRHSYNTTNGLDPAAAGLRNSVTNTNSTNLGIGHSMGGVMIREVDRMPIAGNSSAPKKFGGYITIASPNYGAPISANVINGSVNSAAATALDRLTAGCFSESPVLALPWAIISGWSTTKVANSFLDRVDFMSAATNNDLKEGSTRMNLLNENSAFVPVVNRISIIAEETSPVHWRMTGSMVFGAGSSGNPGDQQMVSLANQLRGSYQNKVDFHDAAYKLNIFPFPNPIAMAYHLNCVNQWKKGRDWLDQSETIWCNLIKTTKTVTTTQWQWVWLSCTKPNCPCKKMPIEDEFGNPLYTLCREKVWMEVTTTVTTTYKNDGLLPTYAQELKGVSGSNRYVIDHANHMELKNMSFSKKPNGQANDGTKIKLNEIFDRSGWFFTPRR